MAIERGVTTIPVQITGDLSTYKYHVLTLSGARAYTTANVAGLLRTKSISGDHAAVGIFGNMKYKAGGTVAIGGHLTVSASATLEQATSGDIVFGKALAAVASGDIGEGFFNFASPGTLVTSAL